MSQTQPNLQSLRAKKARLGRQLGKNTYKICIYAIILLIAGAVILYVARHVQISYLLGSLSLAILMIAQWDRFDLDKLPVSTKSKDLTDILPGDVLALLSPDNEVTPQSVWHDLKNHWQVIFLTNHFLLPADSIEQMLSTNEADMATVWEEASRLSNLTETPNLEAGYIATALLLVTPSIQVSLTKLKLTQSDIENLVRWLGRGLDSMNAAKPYFGGIGRDWANGFTPQLNRFGRNVSLSIERQGAHFGALTTSPGVKAIKNSFSQGATAVALIGEGGSGKTSHVYALAQLLLEEKHDRNLEHRQIISLNPSVIISSATRQGELESIMLTLIHETAHAGHIILFLDDAQLFLASGLGSFDITRILLPVMQSKAIQIVLAMTPHDYQQLKANNSAFAGLLTPVVLQDMEEPDVLRVLEDTTNGLESRHKVLIAYEALKEAYRLSGRYEQDIAYPGKAIQLLEQSLTHTSNGVVTAQSVQEAIEQTRGVKVGGVAPIEADRLLNLEADIHKRMINQSRAVSVVSNALRRARAGVSNPKRPIGSFLFLGPTGVGKTELAKAVAATYFGSEQNMIRLDMSEYQQAEDVNRLLSNGQGETTSLIMAVRNQPFSVVLLDEIEKAHPNILNLLLQLLDEGQLTDIGGRTASFKDAILIATSNAGANSIREHIKQGEELENFEKPFIDELINGGLFRPELLNRFDDIVLFRPLKPEELLQVVGLMMQEVNRTLSTQNITVSLTPAASQKIVDVGNDPRLGARPMRRALQRAVEDTIADNILRGQANPGDAITLDVSDLRL
ncbi:MAG: AAA family ATPase [Candidatus Saccharimonadales bacterium]